MFKQTGTPARRVTGFVAEILNLHASVYVFSVARHSTGIIEWLGHANIETTQINDRRNMNPRIRASASYGATVV
jgi:hypothetical protein